MKNPLISIIIPVYNGENYLDAAVESAMRQSVEDLEIFILDDASSDNTMQIAKELCARDSRILYHRNLQNIGVAKTRNHGFDLAKGQYIALLDADDIWLKNKLELQLAKMKKDKLDVCYTGYSFIDVNGNPFGKPYYVPKTLAMKRLVGENVVGCSTSLLRKSAVSGVRMRPEYAHEDYVFWLELMQKGYRFGGIKEPLVLYRVMPSSRSGNKRRAAISRWKIYRDFLKMNPVSALMKFSSYAVKGALKYFYLK